MQWLDGSKCNLPVLNSSFRLKFTFDSVRNSATAATVAAADSSPDNNAIQEEMKAAWLQQ